MAQALVAAARRTEESDQAAQWIQEAVEIIEYVGARRDIADAQAVRRARGIRPGSRGSRRRPATGWDSLTGSERRVVELVAQGLTNPEIGRRLFTSRRTVETHLAHVFGKLGVRSRVQLAAEAARRPPTWD